MKQLSKLRILAVAACFGALVATGANAGEITLVASLGPLPDVMGTLVPMFESATGNKVKADFKSGAQIAADIKRGGADVVIADREAVNALASSGDVAADQGLVMISKVGIGVKAGAPKPDVSTADHLKAALLAAKSVGYSQATSGQHVVTVLEKLGIADAVKAKAVIVTGRPVGAAIASGEAEIGFQQVAELRPVAGVVVIGELPPDLQKQIPYSVGIAVKTKDAATARALVAFLRSEPAQEVLKRKGMDLP